MDWDEIQRAANDNLAKTKDYRKFEYRWVNSNPANITKRMHAGFRMPDFPPDELKKVGLDQMVGADGAIHMGDLVLMRRPTEMGEESEIRKFAESLRRDAIRPDRLDEKPKPPPRREDYMTAAKNKLKEAKRRQS